MRALTVIDRILGDSREPVHADPDDPRPSRRLAVVTCMDARIDVLAVLGLRLGQAHVIRNAGARVTEDVLRSLALSAHSLGVDSVVVMQHTRCRVVGVTNEELREVTGADLDFLPIDDQHAVLRGDVERLTSVPYLAPLTHVAGVVYDIASRSVEDVVRWQRSS